MVDGQCRQVFNNEMSAILAVVWRAYYSLCGRGLFSLLVDVCQSR
nr:MAG TPA: hypothetical protein [Caudoviricetes sp.]